MAIPIIFFHNGNSKYLKYSLKQAKYFNPDSIVYLLGDKRNNRYAFVTHVLASKYQSAVTAFSDVYVHRTTNGEVYELNCFLRWFYIEAFCRENNIESFIYLDSDVLLFQNVTEMVSLFKGCSIANTCPDMGMPAFTYFKNLNAISSFCRYLMHAYTDEEATKELEHIYEPFVNDPELMGGICDMSLFHLYFRDHPNETLKVDLINNELAVDVSINNSDGYEMENGRKKIYWQNNLPYCKQLQTGRLIRFATLHYQGDAKYLMTEHYKGGGYLFCRFWESRKQRSAKK
ncbi:hypothetical protein EWM62_16750 [Mucilaginibacter terrigena]|uniref:Nucleotide-diphospho-sugar transferase domain-containing protein n=1 Tax=Mucilaginibacter terrigena TaxID=2492395 RepID=A0A4Q5LI91_9SPHI|nr:hypothetical protein [Mucilaginibacter terrigena]RYU87357.1 hypothetical protein EWM62_16750 [Mucilaginibacter terrigena]